jgi:hypothetical protein
MAVTRYQIISLRVQYAGEILKFQHKIPAYLTCCIGFKLSMVGVMPPALLNTTLGRLSASFNSLKEEAITTSLKFEELGSQDFQQLEVQLHTGQIVSGVYVDTMLSEEFKPYRLNLYLRCTDKEGQTTKTKSACTTT